MSFFRRYQSWIYLFGAVVFEVGGTSIMKISQSGHWLIGEGVGVVLMLVMIALSYYMLALAVQGMPVGVAFAFWEGLGLTLITLISVFALGESMSLTRFFALVCVMFGVLLIHHGTGHGPEHGPDQGAALESDQTPAQEVGHFPGSAIGHTSGQAVAQGRAS